MIKECAMKNKTKSVTKKIIITMIIILAILIILTTAFIIFKLTTLNSSINNPLDRKHSELRDKPLKDGEPISIALFGIDSDEVRASENGGQRSDSIVLLSIIRKIKKLK